MLALEIILVALAAIRANALRSALTSLGIVIGVSAVIAMVADVSYGEIGRAIHIHPTLAEGVNAAAGGVHRPSAD